MDKIKIELIEKSSPEISKKHNIYSFDIDGISRDCLFDLMYQKKGSPTVQSTRYAFSKLPDEMKEAEKNNKIEDFVKKYTVMPGDITGEMQALIIDMRWNVLKNFCYMLEKYKADTAKYELPGYFRTSLVWTLTEKDIDDLIEEFGAVLTHETGLIGYRFKQAKEL